MQKRIWVSWETQRRSIELSKILKCSLFIFDLNGPLRYPLSLMKTLYVFIKEQPSIIFVQNPSMFLAAFACIYCKLASIPLIIDRHTTFLLDNKIENPFKQWCFLLLHRFTIKNADITIVTNDHLAQLVSQDHGTPIILPDPLPDISFIKLVPTHGRISIIIPSSFRFDEPLEQIVLAITTLQQDGFFFYLTGNYKQLTSTIKDRMPSNAFLTGFLPEEDYFNLLFSIDAVMVLTTATSCMLCGCYEAIAAKKPLITSLKPCLINYFYNALFVDNSVEGIVAACREMARNIEVYKNKSTSMKETINHQWGVYLSTLEDTLLLIHK
jgi:hypothetical protein